MLERQQTHSGRSNSPFGWLDNVITQERQFFLCLFELAPSSAQIHHFLYAFCFLVPLQEISAYSKITKKFICFLLKVNSFSFTFLSMIHSPVLLGSMDGCSFSSYNSYPHAPASLVKRLYVQHRINLTPLSKNQLAIYVWIIVWLICLSTLKSVPHCLDYWTIF